MLIRRRQSWTRQPQQPLDVDWKNPIAAGLVFDTNVANGLFDSVGRKFGEALSTAIKPVGGPYGLELDFPGNQTNRSASFGNAFTALNGATSAAWEILVRFDSTSDTPHFFSQWDSGLCWLLEKNGTGLIWVAADDNSGNRRRWDAGSLFPAAGYYHILASWLGGPNKALVVNGIDKTSSLSAVNSAATVIGDNTGSDYLQLGMANGGVALNGGIVFARIWNRGLSLDECMRRAANMWGIYRPEVRQVYFVAPAGALDASASGGAQAGGSAALAANVALAAIGLAVAGGSAQASVDIPLFAAGITVAGGSANAAAMVTISAAGLAQAAGQAGLSANVLLAGAGAAQAAGNAALAAQLTALASGGAQAGGSANLQSGAQGSISASGADVAGGTAVIQVTVQIAASGAGQAGGSANLTGGAPGQISAVGGAQSAGAGTLSATVQITAAGFVQAMGAGVFSAQIPLAAFASAVAGGSAVLTLAGQMVQSFRRIAMQPRSRTVLKPSRNLTVTYVP